MPSPARPHPADALSAATTVVGVIGDPVAHSLSPLLHNVAFAELGIDWVSVGFPVAGGQAAAALAGMRALGIRGLSVTMPHKEQVAALVDRCTEGAARLRSVNCVTNDGGTLVGDSTDGAGLVAALTRNGFDPSGRRCLVVGAGGAARAVIAALAGAGAAEVVVANRTASRAQEAAALAGAVGRVGMATDASSSDLVVNATPAGMGGTGAAPWALDPGLLRPGQVVVDLVYHPLVTPWLGAAAERGATTYNGLGMLAHQAALQLERWTGHPAPVEVMWRSLVAATSG